MPVTHLECTRCNQRYEPGQVLTVCTVDGAPLFARYDLERAAKNMRPGHLALREPTLWRYDDVLPVDSPDHRVSLGEGFTPLLTARRLGSLIGLPRLYIKDESGEPTGSFKARGLSLAVSMAKALGATDVCLPSAGNAGSALAAYAAKGGLKAHVFVPKDIAQLFLMNPQRRPLKGRTFGAGRPDFNSRCTGKPLVSTGRPQVIRAARTGIAEAFPQLLHSALVAGVRRWPTDLATTSLSANPGRSIFCSRP